MSAWGTGTFDDDFACDWLEDLGDSDPIAFFEHCLDLTGQDDLEYLACVGVVCTAEMIHAICCGRRDELPQPAGQWLRDNRALPVGRLVPAAIGGLRRVLGHQSEMRDRWEDNEELFDSWIAGITDLVDRLGEHQRNRFLSFGQTE